MRRRQRQTGRHVVGAARGYTMIAITVTVAVLAATGLATPLALRGRRATAPTVTGAVPDLAALQHGHHRRDVTVPDPRAEAVRRAQARAATVAAATAIPVPRRTPENESEMPALPVAPFIPAQRSPRP